MLVPNRELGNLIYITFPQLGYYWLRMPESQLKPIPEFLQI
jgi:hypothetical protein